MKLYLSFGLHDLGKAVSSSFTDGYKHLRRSESCKGPSPDELAIFDRLQFRDINSLKTSLGKMIISLLMNITMNQLGGASVIAKFHS